MGESDPTAHDGATVAAYDIARLANVGRAAVSNWRRRYRDFPKPVAGSAASPRYALRDVEAWLTAHGKDFRLGPGDRVWQRIRGTVDDLQLGDLLGYLGAFLVFHRREPRRWRTLARRPDDTLAETLTPAILKAVPELPGGLSAHVDPALVRAAAEAAGDHGHRAVFAFLCDRYLEIHARWRLVTGETVAGLMVELADAGHGVVLDPACGTGSLLLTAHAAGADQLLGQDVDGTAACLAAARLLLHDATTRVRAGDSLRRDAFDAELVDAVVCDPPFNERSWGYDELTSDPRWEYGLPPRGEPELAWAQHCLSRVKPGARVAIVMPAGAASRRAGRRIRSNLLRSGALRAVVNLPGTGPGTATAPDLWVLRRPMPDDPAPSHVLMADASADAATARSAWRGFLTDPSGLQPGPAARAMRIIDLLDDEVDVSPPRHLARASVEDGNDFSSARAAAARAIEELANAVPRFDELAPARRAPEVSLGELVRAGAVAIHQAPLKTTTDAGPASVLTVQDVRRRRAPTGRTTPGPGTVRTEPGDVVLPVASREPVALVLTTGGAVLGPQIYLLRTDPQRLDPHFLAGFLRIRHSQASGYRGGSTAARSEIHRVALPRLPVTEQRAYGEAFRQLTAFEDTARETAALAEALIQRALAGLATGSLRAVAASD